MNHVSRPIARNDLDARRLVGIVLGVAASEVPEWALHFRALYVRCNMGIPVCSAPLPELLRFLDDNETARNAVLALIALGSPSIEIILAAQVQFDARMA